MHRDSLFQIRSILDVEPEFPSILDALRNDVTSFYATTGHSVPTMIDEKIRSTPLLFIRSARIDDAWVKECDCHGAFLSIDGSESPQQASTYLTWTGPNFSVGLDVDELFDVLNDAQREGRLLVAWVTDTVVTLTSVRIDKEFLDFVYVASQSRHLPRFVPTRDYFSSISAAFPALLCADEQRFIGGDGNPVYVAVSCNSEEIDESDTLAVYLSRL